MRLFILSSAALAAVAVVASAASAQELSGADRPKVTFSEVEHGWYTGAELGVLVVQAPGVGGGLGSGVAIGVDVGWDFSEYLGVGIFALATSVSTPAGYQGFGGAASTGGDFTGIMPGLEVKLHLPIAKDQNDVSRLFLNVGLGGGLMFLTPAALFPSSGDAPAGKVDVSLEYFTRLRHFSVGLALEGLAAFPSGGQIFGGDLSPFIRYSF
jgi:hypothetical protein